jgi:hypothetical protein
MSESEVILSIGDKLHVATRSLYPGEPHLHFIGSVSAVSAPIFRLTGYAFVYDPASHSYFQHPELRTRLFSAADTGREITVLPRLIDMDSVRYEIQEGRLLLVDGKGFSMEIAEFGGDGVV